MPRFDAIVSSFTVHAPVVVIGSAERRKGLSALIASGAADFVARDEEHCRHHARERKRVPPDHSPPLRMKRGTVE